MSNKATLPAAGAAALQIEKCPYGTRYIGSGAALIRAGVVRAEQLPGETGPRKKSAVYYKGRPATRGCHYPKDGNYLRITLIGRNRFTVWAPSPEADRVREAMVQQHLQAVAEDEERAKAGLSRLPSSREAYRAAALADLDSALDFALSRVEATEKHGYSFDFNTMQQARAAAERLRAAVRGGSVVFDASRHSQAVASLRERAGLPPEQPRLRLVGGTGVVSSGG